LSFAVSNSFTKKQYNYLKIDETFPHVHLGCGLRQTVEMAIEMQQTISKV